MTTRFGKPYEMLRIAACPIGLALLLLAGCDRFVGDISRLAENTRTATEQLAFKTKQQDQARELQSLPYADDLRRRPSPLFVQRFETREGPGGYFIYDTQTQSTASIGGQSQSGLTYEQAQDALEALTDADAKDSLP